MMKIDISKMNKEELQVVLKDLRLYRDLEKDLGERGRELFDRIKNGKHSFQVEHFSAVSQDTAWISAQQIFKKVFEVSPKKEEVEFNQIETLKGGIKVYYDDRVVDMSFDKVEKALKNA